MRDRSCRPRLFIPLIWTVSINGEAGLPGSWPGIIVRPKRDVAPWPSSGGLSTGGSASKIPSPEERRRKSSRLRWGLGLGLEPLGVGRSAFEQLGQGWLGPGLGLGLGAVRVRVRVVRVSRGVVSLLSFGKREPSSVPWEARDAAVLVEDSGDRKRDLLERSTKDGVEWSAEFGGCVRKSALSVKDLQVVY
jgi:hypothetical protein